MVEIEIYKKDLSGYLQKPIETSRQNLVFLFLKNVWIKISFIQITFFFLFCLSPWFRSWIGI